MQHQGLHLYTGAAPGKPLSRAACLQVLNLTCTACGKPCRTQTECDLHTKRTGHADFVDKVRTGFTGPDK